MKDDGKKKHEILSDWLSNQIVSGEFSVGDRIPSECELAEQFQISRQTVRRAVETLERKKLLKRTRGSGTYVTAPENSVIPNTKSIGVIITYMNEYVFPSIIQGIHSVLTPAGYTMTLGITYNKTNNEAKTLETMLNSGISGLIIEGTKSALPNANLGLFKILHEQKIPIIFINGYYSDVCESYVVMDDVKAGEVALDFLVKKNHKKIAALFKSDDVQGLKRYEGVSKQISKYGMHIEDNAVIWFTSEDLEYFFEGKMDGIILNRLSDVTAVVCYNDEVAVSLIKLLERNGKRIPEDISIISFDNTLLANQEVYNLTSVTYYGEQIGQTAAQHLLKQIAGEEENCKVKLSPVLKLRQSVKTL